MELNTSWLGLDLKNPIVPSASPLSRSMDAARQLGLVNLSFPVRTTDEERP